MYEHISVDWFTGIWIFVPFMPKINPLLVVIWIIIRVDSLDSRLRNSISSPQWDHGYNPYTYNSCYSKKQFPSSQFLHRMVPSWPQPRMRIQPSVIHSEESKILDWKNGVKYVLEAPIILKFIKLHNKVATAPVSRNKWLRRMLLRISCFHNAPRRNIFQKCCYRCPQIESADMLSSWTREEALVAVRPCTWKQHIEGTDYGGLWTKIDAHVTKRKSERDSW